MKNLYLLGYPLGHSVSPAMQNAALQATGLSDWRYEPLECPPTALEKTLERICGHDFAGANVTIPLKELMQPFMDEQAYSARAIGAINTIVSRRGRLVGENTDAVGFERALTASRVTTKGTRAAIMGAGGAARAVAWTLATSGARSIIILNRTPERARRLAGWLHASFPEIAFLSGAWDNLADADLVVNATSVGMWPDVAQSPLSQGAVLKPGAVAFDLVYSPRETCFMRQAARAGARAIGGLDMLVFQAARAFELWARRPAPVEVMIEAAKRALNEQMHPLEDG